jgi:hypothetical protein
MTQKSMFLFTAALLPDGRILAKVNMRDQARAKDSFVVVSEPDEIYDEALTYAVSYVTLLADGTMEVKARVVDDDNPAQLEAASRRKLQLAPDSIVHKRLNKVVGPLQVGKQVWLDLPKSV